MRASFLTGIATAGVIALGLTAAPAKAAPFIDISTNGSYTYTGTSGMPPALTITGNYAFTDEISSITTPYQLTLGGFVSVDGVVPTVDGQPLQGTSPVFTASLQDLGNDIESFLNSAAGPGAGSLFATAIGDLLAGSVSSTGLGLSASDLDGITFTETSTTTPDGTFTISAAGSGLTTFLGGSGQSGTFAAEATLTDVPEPASLLIVGAGLSCVGLIRRRRAG